MTTILDLASADVELRRVASTNGGEYVGPCPVCGGVDRFHVWPKTDKFWCRKCGANGGTIKYLMLTRNMQAGEARAALGLERPQRRCRVVAERRPPEMRHPPALKWHDQARAYVDRAQRSLWGPAGRAALAYLRSRGLTDATIKAASIGYSPADSFAAPELWGFAESMRQGERKPPRVWLPRGIVIPCAVDGVLWYVKVRRLPIDTVRCPRCKTERAGPGRCQCGADLPRYVMVRGSVPALFGADSAPNRDAIVFVGGEFDALLLGQQVGDLAAVVTWGSETGLTNIDQLAPFAGYLLPVFDRPRPVALAALDSDDAGRLGTDALMRVSAHVRPAGLPQAPGKDITDWHLAGVDLRFWLAEELVRAGGSVPPAKTDQAPLVAINFHDDIPESIRQFAAEVGAVIEVLR